MRTKNRTPFIALFCILLLVSALSGCANSQKQVNAQQEPNISISQIQEQQKQEEQNSQKQAGSTEYPNYPGYPLEKNGIKECKLFINGVVYEDCNGYTKDDYPDTLFITVDPVLYKTYQHTCGLITSSNVNGEDFQLSGKVINGQQVLCAVGKPFLVVDGEVYDDLSPELVEFVEGWEDYCCTTLFLEKTAGAKVHISEDRSAAYIEMNEPISTEDNEKYTLNIGAGGKFTATDKQSGETKTVEVPEKYIPVSQNSNSAGGNGNGGNKSHIPCGTCGGSGRIVIGGGNVYNPYSKSYELKMQYGMCPSCGGRGWL